MSISTDRARNEFNKGNYLSVAMGGGETDWRTHAARGLIDLEHSQAERLSEFDGEEARFYCAVLHWMDGNEKAAIPILEQSSLPVAQRLLNILAAPKLRVISQMIEEDPSPRALFRGASCDERFELTNIDFWPHPDKATPSADVTDYLDSPDPPVFFISSIVEWNPLLDKMEQLGCPVFGHVTDYDIAFQTLLPSLQRFDEIIVGGETVMLYFDQNLDLSYQKQKISQIKELKMPINMIKHLKILKRLPFPKDQRITKLFIIYI